MNVFFRADASINIGTGHIMRCLTLADELKQRRVNISFFCCEETGDLIELIEDKGYKVYRLSANIDLETDSALIQSILKDQMVPPHWLIVDHYSLDISWESPIRKFVKKVMVIDDLSDRQHDCDLLLDQNFNFNENRYQELVPNHCIKLLGPKYALLRPQFRKVRENLRERNGAVKRILVFLGGSDPSNETCKVLRAIQILNRPDISTDVVIGVTNAHRTEIETVASQIPNVSCHYHVADMAKLMVAANLCIGASGTTTWERCCVGLPSVVITLAKNQIDIAENLGKSGVVINLGWYENVTEIEIKKAVESLISNPYKREMMSIRGKETVDGTGAKKVAGEICKLIQSL